MGQIPFFGAFYITQGDQSDRSNTGQAQRKLSRRHEVAVWAARITMTTMKTDGIASAVKGLRSRLDSELFLRDGRSFFENCKGSAITGGHEAMQDLTAKTSGTKSDHPVDESCNSQSDEDILDRLMGYIDQAFVDRWHENRKIRIDAEGELTGM